MCDEFGVYGKLHVEVIRTCFFMARGEMDCTMTPTMFDISESFG